MAIKVRGTWTFWDNSSIFRFLKISSRCISLFSFFPLFFFRNIVSMNKVSEACEPEFLLRFIFRRIIIIFMLFKASLFLKFVFSKSLAFTFFWVKVIILSESVPELSFDLLLLLFGLDCFSHYYFLYFFLTYALPFRLLLCHHSVH